MNEELKIIITAEISKLKKELETAQRKVKETADKGESGFKKFGNAAKTAGKAVAAGLKVALTAIAAGATALVALAESTREYRTEQAKLNTAFETAGAKAGQAQKTYNDLYRVLGESDVAVEAAGHLAQLTTNEKELSEWTTICQGVYATFGDSLPIEGLTEAANETAKVGKVTGQLADALNWAGISEDEFNQKLEACNDEAEREKLIRSTLTKTYKEAAAQYEKTAKSILDANEAQAKLTQGLAELGEAVEPVVTIFKKGFADALLGITPQFKKVTQALTDMVNGVKGSKEKLGKAVEDLMGNIITTITTKLPKIIEVGTQIVMSLANGIAKNLPQIAQCAVEMVTKLAETVIQELPTLIQNIVNALPSTITILINGIVNLFSMITSNISQIIAPIIEALPDILVAIVDGVMSNLDVLIEGCINLVLAIVENIPLIIQGLIEALPQIIESIVKGLIECVPQLIEGLIKVIAGVVAALPQIFIELVNGISKIFTDIWNGICEIFAPVAEWFGDIFGKAWEAIQKAWDAVVQWFQDLWNGICNVFKDIGTWFGDKWDEAWKAVTDAWDGAVQWFQDLLDKIWLAFDTTIGWIEDAWNGLMWLLGIKTEETKVDVETATTFMKNGFSGISPVAKQAANTIYNEFKKAGNNTKGLMGGVCTTVCNLLDRMKLTASSTHSFISGLSFAVSGFNIPKMATGGIVNTPTFAQIGEAGTEAVVPLENNLGWLDKLAGMLGDRLGVGNSNRPIVLQVDGKTFAQTSIDSINQLTKQTGVLPLRIV
jgi:hypothetical protein